MTLSIPRPENTGPAPLPFLDDLASLNNTGTSLRRDRLSKTPFLDRPSWHGVNPTGLDQVAQRLALAERAHPVRVRNHIVNDPVRIGLGVLA